MRSIEIHTVLLLLCVMAVKVDASSCDLSIMLTASNNGMIVVIISVFLVTLLMGTCRGKKGDEETRRDQRSPLHPFPLSSNEDSIKLTPAIADFALSILRAAADLTTNTVISPFSFGAALAIVHDGAKEDTQKELTSLLGKTLSPTEVSSLYSSLTAALSGQNSAVITRVANRLFLDKAFRLKSEYQSHVEKVFNAGAETINFKDGAGSAQHVNAFVATKTGGMIQKVVQASAFGDNAIAVLINAVYFKGEWEKQFNKDDTQMKTFHGIAGDRDEKFMIDNKRTTRYSLHDNLTVVSLHYKDPSYSLVVLMPSGDFGEWRAKLSAEKLQAAIETQQAGDINLILPKFQIESTTDGKVALEKCGVKRIFENTANLTGISDKDLNVSMIVHKATIDITEEGTEAAAATEVTVIRSMGGPPRLAFDRPFVFFVVKENIVVFAGQFV